MGEERIDVSFNTREAAQALEALSKRVDALGAKAKGITLGGVVQSAANAGFGGATGQAIASFAASSPMDKLLTIAEQITAMYFPQILSKLDVLAPRQSAFSQVAQLAELGGRLNMPLSNDTLNKLAKETIAQEERAQEQRNRVRSLIMNDARRTSVDALADWLDENFPAGPDNRGPRNR